jgi:hypothetical protein
MADNRFDKENEQLWEFLWELWDKGENRTEIVKEYYQYWDGTLTPPPNSPFSDQKKTSCNIIKEIVEAKLANTLDAKFSVSVVPKYNSFSDFKTIKEQQAYADILNDELHNVLKDNRFDNHKEIVGRWGLVGGFGIGQTTFCTDEKVEGEIKIDSIDPKDQPIRWNRGAKKQDELTFVAYQTELNPAIVKKRYARKPDGKWDEELCKKIDDITEVKTDISKGERKGVVNISSNETTDLAFVYGKMGIGAGKIVKLIVMFLLDDSLSAPEQNDDESKKKEKITLKSKYPNGRMIIFSTNKKNKIILDDVPAPEGFKSLGNIDFFNPMEFSDLTGKGEVEDLIGIQDRINGAYLKIRVLIANHVKSIGMDMDLDAETTDSDLINQPVIKLRGIGRDAAKVPQVVSNDTLLDVQQLIPYIEGLKTNAKNNARVNDTFISGQRQPGTTSSDMIEDLKESTMASIRTIQRNFKDYVIRIGEKVITLIQKNYTVQRLISLSTGIPLKYENRDILSKMARFNQNDNGRYIELLSEAGKTVKTIKINPDWGFKVDVIAGTEIPRSRRENATLMDSLYKDGVLGDPEDIDVKEQYLRAIDVPNNRAIVTLLKRKSQVPIPMPSLEMILSNRDMAVALAEILKGLQGFSGAKQQILKALKLIEDTDKLDTAPVQEITSKADVKDVAAVAPDVISDDPEKVMRGSIIAEVLEIVNNLPDEDVAKVMGFLKTEVKGRK